MFKQIIIRVAHELEQGLTLLVNDFVGGKKARKGRKWATYKAPKPAKAPRAQSRVTRAYRPFVAASAPRMVVVHIHEGAIVHF